MNQLNNNKMEGKLSFEQIIQKLKEANITVSEFAFEDVGGNINDYPEAVEAQKARKEYYEKWNEKWYGDGGEKIREAYYAMPSEYDIATRKFKESLNLNWEEIEQVGGEDEGSHWHSVKYFPDHDVYICVTGYYSSYNGTDFYDEWGCCTEVRPQQKTITVYC